MKKIQKINEMKMFEYAELMNERKKPGSVHLNAPSQQMINIEYYQKIWLTPLVKQILKFFIINLTGPIGIDFFDHPL